MLGESLPHLNTLDVGGLVGRCKPLLSATGQSGARAGLMATSCIWPPLEAQWALSYLFPKVQGGLSSLLDFFSMGLLYE